MYYLFHNNFYIWCEIGIEVQFVHCSHLVIYLFFFTTCWKGFLLPSYLLWHLCLKSTDHTYIHLFMNCLSCLIDLFSYSYTNTTNSVDYCSFIVSLDISYYNFSVLVLPFQVFFGYSRCIVIPYKF